MRSTVRFMDLVKMDYGVNIIGDRCGGEVYWFVYFDGRESELMEIVRSYVDDSKCQLDEGCGERLFDKIQSMTTSI
jgi:hypothetical protein